MEALSCAKSWCSYSSKTFVPNAKFIEVLFQMLGASEEYFGKAVTILKRLLSKNFFAKALEQMSFAEAYKGIPEQDMAFLRSVIQLMWNMRPVFVNHCQQDFTEEDDEKSFPRKYCSLLVTLCSNYEIFLIENSEQSQQLITLLKDSATAKNLRLAIMSLECWYQVHETITTRFLDIQGAEQGEDNEAFLANHMHLFTMFQEIIPFLLVSC